MAEIIITASIAVLILIILAALVSIAAIIFWIVMLIDCLTRKFRDMDKVVWVLVLLFANIIGAVIYYFIIKKQDRS